MIEWHNVESSQIARLGYVDSGRVRVEFKNKSGAITSTWEYGSDAHPMTRSDFDAWLKSASMGRFLQSHVKGIFDAKKVG